MSDRVQVCKHKVPIVPHIKCLKCEGNIHQKKIEIYEAALKKIEDNPCCGTYGPCGAADHSVSIAEDALEEEK